jgi:capsule polysaccharide export protein KpsE/RkpR
MAAHTQLGPAAAQVVAAPVGHTATWTGRAVLLWSRRQLLLVVTTVALVLSIGIVLLIPKEYESTARIMPPDQAGSGASLLALMATRSSSLGPLGTLASGLMGAHTTTGLFVSLLQSGTVSGHLVDRFQLQSVYHKRYQTDAAKRLARNTHITDDKKSGVITIQVSDRDPRRARDLAQAYLDQLNNLVRQTSNSAARQERIFLEQRLRTATADLERAQTALSEYSTRNNTIDLKEQTRAMVDAGARVEGELVLEQSTLNSLRQVYGNNNVRVRQVEARIGTLQRELRKVNGSPSEPGEASVPSTTSATTDFYPPLRQLPRLAVPYADLYRAVRVQETIFELLTQQYESARIEEAKDIPAVNVIDSPDIPEKKSFPPRTLLILLLTLFSTATAAGYILLSAGWDTLPFNDERRLLANDILRVLRPTSAHGRGGVE